jgi:hypothetical protein
MNNLFLKKIHKTAETRTCFKPDKILTAVACESGRKEGEKRRLR